MVVIFYWFLIFLACQQEVASRAVLQYLQDRWNNQYVVQVCVIMLLFSFSVCLFQPPSLPFSHLETCPWTPSPSSHIRDSLSHYAAAPTSIFRFPLVAFRNTFSNRYTTEAGSNPDLSFLCHLSFSFIAFLFFSPSSFQGCLDSVSSPTCVFGPLVPPRWFDVVDFSTSILPEPNTLWWWNAGSAGNVNSIMMLCIKLVNSLFVLFVSSVEGSACSLEISRCFAIIQHLSWCPFSLAERFYVTSCRSISTNFFH